MGAMVFRSPYDKRAIFNHEKLYEPLREKVITASDIAAHMPAIRELIAKGEFKVTNNLF